MVCGKRAVKQIPVLCETQKNSKLIWNKTLK